MTVRASGVAILPSNHACDRLRRNPPAVIAGIVLKVATCALIGVALVSSSGCQSDEERIASFIERGEDYAESGDHAEAIIEFKNVLQLDPENAEAHEALSLAYLNENKPREAYWEMSETVRVDPANVDARLRYGTISAAIGDHDLALEQAEAVLEMEPGNARGFTLRAQAREAREEYEGAESDLRGAIAGEPEAPAFRFLLGGFLERRGRFEEAEDVYRELLDVEASYLVGASYARTVIRNSERDDPRVDQVIDRVVELAEKAPVEAPEPDPDDVSRSTSLANNVLREEAIRAAYSLKSAVAFDRGNLDEAIAILEEGVQKSESKVELIYQMANLYRRKGDLEQESAMIRRATEEAPGNASAQLVLSAYLGQKGDLAGALAAARAAVSVEPDSQAALLREAELLVDIGFREGSPEKIQEGRAIVDSVLEAMPESPEGFFVKAKIELAENDLAAAQASLETTLQARPDWAQARFVLGSALASKGELTRARVELESAVEKEARLADARGLLTRIYAQLGEHEFAVEEGRRYLQDRPSDHAIRIVVGQSLIRVGRAEEAYAEIDQIPDEQRDAGALFALGRLDLAFGRVEEGTAKMKRADELAPGNAQVLRTLLDVDRSKNDIEPSLERIERALKAKPEDSELTELQAEAQLLAGDLPAAKASLERAVELEARNVTAQLALADLARRDGDMDRMLAVMERASAAVPESSDLVFRLAQAYEQAGRRSDAIESYERAIALNGDLALAKNNLAYLLVESGGDLDRALELAQQAKEQMPDDGNAADTLGWVLLKRGVPSAAIGYLEEAAEQFEGKAFEIQGLVRNHLAEAYEANRDTAKAIAESRRVIELYESLQKLAKERSIEFDEPEWSLDSRARVARLESTS